MKSLRVLLPLLALLAVPLTASLKVIFRRYIWERRVQPQLTAPSDYPVS